MDPVALVLIGSRHVNKRTCRFVESLRASGFDPVVLAVPRRSWSTSGIEDPALLGRRGAVTLRGNESRARRVHRPDLVVCMHWSVLPVAMFLRVVWRCRVLYDEHDHYELLTLEGRGPTWVKRVRASLIGRVHAWCLPHVDVVTCIRLTDGRLEKHLRSWSETVLELHNYPARRWGQQGRHRSGSDGSLALVYVGGIWQEKGCEVMLDAFLRLADEPSLPPMTLHVFGQGDPAIERRLDAAGGVTFHGLSSHEEIVSFLTSHDCLGLVLLDATPRYSMVSTNCHKLYEYLAAGVPVLATEVGDLPDIVADLDGGWTLPAGFDAATLADVLREIAGQPDEIRRRGAEATAAVERNALWWEAEWQKVEALGVLGRRGGDV